MNEIDLWTEGEQLINEKEEQLQNIGYNLLELFSWSEYPTNENDFDEYYNRIYNGESLEEIIQKNKKKEK